MLLAVSAGLVLLTLNQPVANDFERYVVLSGFEASRWTWLLVAGAATFAIVSQFAKSNRRSVAAVSAIAAVCVSSAIFWTVRETPHRVEAVHNVVDCANQNIAITCHMIQLLDKLESGPPRAAPSRALLVAALGTYGLIAGTLTLRKPTV